MLLNGTGTMTAEAARLISPLRLAYIGDTVWELLVRLTLFGRGQNVRHMHQGAVAGVNAGAQAAALRVLEPLLTEEETDMVRRGRNAHARHPAPRHQQPADYQSATALETLMGYLYLTGQEERLRQLFLAAQDTAQEVNTCPPQS